MSYKRESKKQYDVRKSPARNSLYTFSPQLDRSPADTKKLNKKLRPVILSILNDYESSKKYPIKPFKPGEKEFVLNTIIDMFDNNLITPKYLTANFAAVVRSIRSNFGFNSSVKRRSVKSRSVKSRSVKSRSVKSRSVKRRSVKRRSVKRRSVKRRSVKRRS
jgi:hypothetical protein